MTNDQNGIKKYLKVHAGSMMLVIVIQSISLVWWASGINTRVNILDRDVEKIDARVYGLEVDPK